MRTARLDLLFFSTCLFLFAALPCFLYADNEGRLHTKCNLGQESFSQQIAAIRQGIAVTIERPVLPRFLEDSQGRFRVHYTVSGPDAVPLLDADGTNVPDYVEECIRALLLSQRTYIDTFLYIMPPNDLEKGGSNAVDVYLKDLSQAGSGGYGVYGLTIPETVVNAGPPERYSSWMMMDNDFSPDDRSADGSPAFSTYGIDALRITSSHEYHHVIQIGSYGVSPSQLMVYELTSTYYEQRLWPDVLDWHVYTKELLRAPALWPLSNANSSNGYVWGWFGNVLCKNDDQTVLRRTWEHISTNKRPFQALALACKDVTQTDLATLFCNSMDWLYYTGSRGKDNPYLFRAELLPEIQLSVDQTAVHPSMIAAGDLLPFEVRCLRYAIPAISVGYPTSTSITITWPNEAAFVESANAIRQGYSVLTTSTPSMGDIPISGTMWGVRVSPQSICSKISGVQSTQTLSPFPNPFILSSHTMLSLPVSGKLPGDQIEFELLTIQMNVVDAGMMDVAFVSSFVVASYEPPSNLTPGLYLIKLRAETADLFYKFQVKR